MSSVLKKKKTGPKKLRLRNCSITSFPQTVITFQTRALWLHHLILHLIMLSIIKYSNYTHEKVDIMSMTMPLSPFYCTSTDLSRMFSLVTRVPKGLEELRDRFENHVHAQGVAAVEKCGEAALNVNTCTR